ncbi:Gfo/Idh/MocA family protein [Fusibacter ferrireducens]|uniref:Gfo/Idh/MocA family oxidoreductase n=1 Tax=Fusibacter ferrireducens TaxID=2785058 RepID=A0ABR9ZXF0_9FIRM|nr:Gfo/Idh/MocA family oxidoreductase [Fusibacter ferrireducens]MBF4695132.1 Gfo/Idh/MocA family oxidoreductase [Fusibacter ferrireducens]
MKIVVIGLGSMGRRRVRLIKKYNDSYKIIGVDLSEERRTLSENEFGIETNESLESVIKNNEINCAMICTSPLSHSKLISLCLKNDMHVFTELNLVTDGYDENIQLAKEKNKILFLSSTFLHRAEIKKINSLVKEQDKMLNYTYHIGQYLPDWHPWENYKDFFVGDKRTNGCREIFAIELPWLIEVFGDIKDFIVRKSKISSLNIDYDDNYMVIFEHESGHKGMVSIDVVSRKSVRNLEIYGENLYLSWDGSAKGLKMMDIKNKREDHILLYEKVDQLNQYSSFVVENAYYDEIESFFDVIEKDIVLIYNFEKDKKILKLIDRIEA